MKSGRGVLLVIMTGYLASGAWGLEWGVYNDLRAQHLFPDGSTWAADDVATVIGTPPSDRALGADVDPNPIPGAAAPVRLTGTLEERAELYARFLLYSGQPDEMISFRAIAQMKPAEGQLDPRLYQYGGLFIYPLAGLLKLAALSGLITAGDRAYYLSHPHEFARFYLIGRGMVLAWGVLGVWLAWAIGRQLGGPRAAPLAALLFTALPVVVSLSHEAKPHLPGTVLMLAALYWALRYHDSGHPRHRFYMAALCGLAVGMVLSSMWIVVLIPLVEWLVPSSLSERLSRTMGALAAAAFAYGVTNPYVMVNLITNRKLLMSNIGNSTAMYAVGDGWSALGTASALLAEGSSVIVIAAGLFVVVALWGWDWRKTLLVLLPAMIMFTQFALLAEGKPGEYGRFGLFPNAILAIVVAAGCARFLARRWYQSLLYALALATPLAWGSIDYFVRFHQDTTVRNSRYEVSRALVSLAEQTMGEERPTIGVLRDPAPYAFPPLDFARWDIVRLPGDVASWPQDKTGWPTVLVVPFNGVEHVDVAEILRDGYYASTVQPLPSDRASMTWAAKPVLLLSAVKG